MTERLHQAVARKLGTAILAGDFKPGDGFEGEIEHAVSLGVSRTAYREALRILIAKGLVETRPRSGAHITPRSRWSLLDPVILEWAFSREPDAKFVKGLFELRSVIEPAAAALAARRRTPAQVATMAEALDVMAQHSLATDAGQAADQRFHKALIEATDNETLAALASSVAAAVRWTTRFKQREYALPRDPLPEHRAVFAAIADKKPGKAKAAMDELLRLALADMQL